MLPFLLEVVFQVVQFYPFCVLELVVYLRSLDFKLVRK